MQVKICGITVTSDGTAAVNMGASILGVVLSGGSIRKGSPELISELKSLGYTVAAVHTSLDDALDLIGDEDYIQLHFRHSAEDVRGVKKHGKKIISVLSVDSEPELIKEIHAVSNMILFEHKPFIVGEMRKVAPYLDAMAGVAGGIDSGNVREIMEHGPGIIDVSSSLEYMPGRKSVQKIEEFFREVKFFEKTCRQST